MSSTDLFAGTDATPAQVRREVVRRLQQDTRFVVATHENPDGDALGSLVAMHGLLKSLGKDVEMFMAQRDLPLPDEYSLFVLQDLIHEVPEDIGERTIVFLDCGNIDRSPSLVLSGGAFLVNIDHHHDNTLFGTLNHVVADASCTAELVWEIYLELGITPPVPIAEALYVGLVTDTGRFMYESTGPRAHQMAAALIEAGVQVQTVYRRLYEDVPLARLALLARALGAVQRFDAGTLTLASLTAEDFALAEAGQADAEGIVDHLRAVRATKVAALVRQLTDADRLGESKVSLRAIDDDVDVSQIARAQGGGGHRRAAGFSTSLAVDELIAFLRAEIQAQLGHSAPLG
jgi:phosphoesterase RecJ-like protein